MRTTLIKNIKSIYGITNNADNAFKKGHQMKNVGIIHDAYILFDTKILEFGPMSDCPDRADNILDGSDSILLPAWCDSHSHIVFAGSRENEFVLRLQGKTYEEIAKSGGGILNSAEKLQKTRPEDLYRDAHKRLNEVISYGTGAIEIKSGYGLTFESEINMLKVIRLLKENSDVEIKATFLGAHAIPKQYAADRNAYIRIVTEEMLPYIATNNLADYCDVFCDEGFYTVDETDHILQKAANLGLKAKIHANELANSGGVQVGIKNNAVSVDHLERIGMEEIECLKHSDTVPTALPNVSFFLNIPYAPCRQMIDAGLGIALATDYNPGSSPSGNMALMMAIACHQMKLTPEEVFNAATINGAHAMEIQNTHGSITVGKAASFFLTDNIPNLAYMFYHFGANHIQNIWLNGKIQNK
ncbi:MAG: imidazolonepropionase [Saprospiraceae bacterium]|nr:imidazolonepropionase [Saprospiraceae bacterium]